MMYLEDRLSNLISKSILFYQYIQIKQNSLNQETLSNILG